MAGYQFLLDLVRGVKNVLAPEHGGTGSTYGEERVVVKGLNQTGADLELYSLVQYTFGTNAPKVEKVTALDSAVVLGVVVGYYDGFELVEADAPHGYEVAVQTSGIVRVLIESAVTRGQFAYSAATDGTMYSSATAASGSFGRVIDSADTSQVAYARVSLSPAGAGGGGGGGGASITGKEDGSTVVSGVTAVDVRHGLDGSSSGTEFRIAVDETELDVIQETLIDAKGDLIAGTAADTADRVAVGSNGQVLRARSTATPGVAWEDASGELTVVVNSPAVGDVCDIEMPFDGTWTSWRVFNDTGGSIQYDLWLDTYANFPPTILDTIVGSNKPKTTSADHAQDSGSMTGWTTTFSAGDILRVHVDSTSGGVARSCLSLRYKRR